ncbi:hypothetical protein EDB89DRAFT_2024253 [Lactarius sanguifluus]|nr:hypothetical protein EDB89DRAFT_2024253 [Lactarius sanguifluus]
MENGPPGGLTTSERLELLKNYSASWKNLEWNEHTTIPLPEGSLWELYGNVWAHSRGSDAIEFIQLPSRLRGIPMRQWTLRFDYDLRDFGMDPSQNLLVTVENFRNAPELCRIHLRSLSTGEKHPLAGSTGAVEHTLAVPNIVIDHWSYSIRICRDYVGILFMERFENTNDSELVVWSWRTGVRKLLVLSTSMRSFAFLGDNFILVSTATPPALLVYGLEQRPAYDATHASTYLLHFFIETLLHEASDILLTSDPSPGWSPSAGLQVPFQIAGDERIIAMNLQRIDNWGHLQGETILIPAKTLLGQIESLLIKETHDVVWESYGSQFRERVPLHGGWNVWTCFVFGMRHIMPRVIRLHGKPVIVVRDLSPMRCLRASEEEREESNALHHWQAMTRGSRMSYSILKCVPLPESIRNPQDVDLMISEDAIVVLDERDTVTGQVLIHLLTF